MKWTWLTVAILSAVVTACEAPLSPTDDGSTWSEISMGAGHGCLLNAEGRIACFGANSRGQLGLGNSASPADPAYLPVGPGFVQIDAGAYHTCAIGPVGGVWCWGANDEGQLGLSDRSDRDLPVRLDLPGTYVSVSAGLAHTCVTRFDGIALCWGSNVDGRLGIGSGEPGPFRPVVVEGSWASIAAGARHTCAADRAGALYCWGWNEFAQLGTGTKAATVVPTRVSAASTLLNPAVADDFSCAQDTGALLFCWGGRSAGVPIAGAGPGIGTPVAWADRPVADYSTSSDGLCVAYFDGGVRCDGPGSDRAGLPEWLLGLRGVGRIAWGSDVVCVLSLTGSLDCF